MEHLFWAFALLGSVWLWSTRPWPRTSIVFASPLAMSHLSASIVTRPIGGIPDRAVREDLDKQLAEYFAGKKLSLVIDRGVVVQICDLG